MTPQTEQIIEKMIKDKDFRLAMVRDSLFWFTHFYFGGTYVKYPTADFQREIFQLLENEQHQNIVITAFRGSAKSTIVTMAYVIWSILGKQQKKFPIILGNTQGKAQVHLLAIKHEFEQNELLRADLGPFKEENNQWGALSLVLPQYGAKISTSSVEQSVRGLRHYEHRPDVIVCDDLEDMDSVRTQESRDKLFEWLTSDVLPAGDKDTRMVFIGTPLHEDSLLRRLEKQFETGNPRNVFRRYPIRDENGKPLWPGKFATDADIENEREKCLNERAWLREYMLKIVSPDDQLVKREWIKYYTEFPNGPDVKFRQITIGIDPARSQSATADYTAMVGARVYGVGTERTIYVLPNPVNAKLTTEQILSKVEMLMLAYGAGGKTVRVYVEDVNFQGILAEMLVGKGIRAKLFPLKGKSKEDRLEAIVRLIEVGKILFPQQGAEKLIEQILGFGSEKHDDLVDAFTMTVLQSLEDTKKYAAIYWI
jgi:predicted phage terminase large subunit-like protein